MAFAKELASFSFGILSSLPSKCFSLQKLLPSYISDISGISDLKYKPGVFQVVHVRFGKDKVFLKNSPNSLSHTHPHYTKTGFRHCKCFIWHIYMPYKYDIYDICCINMITLNDRWVVLLSMNLYREK